MLPGPAIVLSCPFCGGTKEVMSLASGNTSGMTLWSDTRREFPMFPEASPIQQCPHCKKYYFYGDADKEYSKDPESSLRSHGQLGKLSYVELKEALKQWESSSPDSRQLWVLHREFFLAYNDAFRRFPDKISIPHSEEDDVLFNKVVWEMLVAVGKAPDLYLFYAELLREVGRLDDAKKVLLQHEREEDQCIVDAMLRHIEENDTLPFLLIDNGKEVS